MTMGYWLQVNAVFVGPSHKEAIKAGKELKRKPFRRLRRPISKQAEVFDKFVNNVSLFRMERFSPYSSEK